MSQPWKKLLFIHVCALGQTFSLSVHRDLLPFLEMFSSKLTTAQFIFHVIFLPCAQESYCSLGNTSVFHKNPGQMKIFPISTKLHSNTMWNIVFCCVIYAIFVYYLSNKFISLFDENHTMLFFCDLQKSYRECPKEGCC